MSNKCPSILPAASFESVYSMQQRGSQLCAGTLPASWAEGGAFPALSQLWLVHVLITGTLPPSWGGNGSLPTLTDLELNYTKLAGPLPAEWGSPTGFQQLQILCVYSCSTNGGRPVLLIDVTASLALSTKHLHHDECSPAACQLWAGFGELLGHEATLLHVVHITMAIMCVCRLIAS